MQLLKSNSTATTLVLNKNKQISPNLKANTFPISSENMLVFQLILQEHMSIKYSI